MNKDFYFNNVIANLIKQEKGYILDKYKLGQKVTYRGKKTRIVGLGESVLGHKYLIKYKNGWKFRLISYNTGSILYYKKKHLDQNVWWVSDHEIEL